DADKMQDLLDQLAGMAGPGDHIAQLEIVAEGSPTTIGNVGVDVSQPPFTDFADQLKAVHGMTANTKVNLSACNTGLSTDLTHFNSDVAQRLANAISKTVYGAKGYISGAHALGDESVEPAPPGKSPYPGCVAQVEGGSKAWRKCVPGGHFSLPAAQI